MVLIAATTDKFMKVGSPGTATTLAAPGFTTGVSTSIQVGSTTNWNTDTKIIFAIDRASIINGVETRIAGTYNEFEGLVTGANTVSSLVKRFGTAQNYVAGSLTRVYIPVSSTRENDMVDGLNVDHNGKGNHKTLSDDNNNEWLERGQVASAVNQVKVSNAITANAPQIIASGDDTNVDLNVDAKGTGVVKVQGSVPQKYFALFDFIESGCVLTGTGYGTTLGWSLTAGFVWINGKRLTVAAATGTVTASRDTYFDLLDAGNGTATLVNTGGNIVTNNAASPALAANSVRAGIIVSGANIANVAAVNQGEESKVLPIASSIAYSVTDSIGNLICPRDPNRKLLGYRQIIVAAGVASTTPGQIPGLSAPVIVPTGRKIKIVVAGRNLYSSTNNAGARLSIWDGVVASGTQLTEATGFQNGGSGSSSAYVEAINTPTSTNKTFNAGLAALSGTGGLDATSTYPIFIKVELE